ncbi:hypothetical protein [Lacinutrix himadriensis]|uniref:hypothetical protein n=1 Tax=Lacinutrix himadriensis TaxID=641549 RepID=UPI0006E12F26|nr:hypothetical protein [Lacinutrix himadriensis]
MKTFKESYLASSIIHWMNYISAVGRDYIIDESTIKIPACEYLEVTGLKPNLEFHHSKFKPVRRIDLQFNNTKNKIESAYEFKYVKKDSTRGKPERIRVFNDLMRLNLYCDSTNKKGFFLICGITDDFEVSFENLNLKPTFLTPKPKNSSKSKSFYSEWFSFDDKLPKKEIALKTNDKSYEEIYQAFLNEYKTPYKEKTGNNLMLPDKIITKLIFLSEVNSATNIPQTFKIGIWEVLK